MLDLQINRRSFLLRSSTALLAAPVIGSTAFLTGCDTSWIATAQKDIPIIANIVTSLAGVALAASGNGVLTPAANALIQAAAQAAQVALTTLQQSIAALAALKSNTPNASLIQQIETVLGTVGANLSNILAAINVKNSNLLNAISSGVALGIATLSSIELLIPASVSVTSALKASHQKQLMTPVKLIDASTLASMYNTVLVSTGYSAQQVADK